MKIAIIGNQARAMNNFWTVLINQMIRAGHQVVCFVPYPHPTEDPVWGKKLEDLGTQVVHYPLERKGLNPFVDLKTIYSLYKLMRQERPDALFAYTIKPIIYSAFASALASYPPKIQRHVMLTGIGFMFEGGSLFKNTLMQLARFLYKMAFTQVNTVFFQNLDDRSLFGDLEITTPKTRVCMSKGTGVDIDYFTPQATVHTPPTFLFVGRLLEAKGLRELRDAAALLRKKYPETRIQILGPEEPGAGNIPLSEILQWQAEGTIEYLGEALDVRPYIAKASVIVLPSWREGTPCSLMEAMSMGRPIVAADAPGSREVVYNDINGFLVPVRQPEKLAEALQRFIDDPSLIDTMGQAGRKIAETEYNAHNVAAKILQDMQIPIAD